MLLASVSFTLIINQFNVVNIYISGSDSLG